MDELSKTFEIEHRYFRHDPMMWIPEHFVQKYGLPLSRAIVRSHIWLDKNWNWYKEKIFWIH
jgi:hypothetical protein